jgi:hypothetical protein
MTGLGGVGLSMRSEAGSGSAAPAFLAAILASIFAIKRSAFGDIFASSFWFQLPLKLCAPLSIFGIEHAIDDPHSWRG